MTADAVPLTPAEVSAQVDVLRDMSFRAHEHGDMLLWMVLHSAAESIADGLDVHLEVMSDGE